MTTSMTTSSRYGWYVVAVLTLAYVSSFIDRQILSLLVAPIRRDLGISDTGMSLLMGLSFAVLYTVLGLPIGRLADGRSRRGIMAWGIAIWSVMTALCGVSRTFWQFFLARVGVGVGEAALSPAAYSMLTDTFPRERLATALSVYSAGIYIGSGAALILGGAVLQWVSGTAQWTFPVIGSVHAWQTMFFVIGLPGLLLALWVWSLREPARRAATAEALPTRETARYVRDNLRTFVCHNVGIGMISLSTYAASAWLPTIYVRQYGWSLPKIGLVYGILIAVFGTTGIIAGGRYADRLLARQQPNAKLKTCLVGVSCLLASCLLLPFAKDNATIGTLLIIPTNFFAAFPYGAAAAAVQELSPNRMRAQISALYLFVVNLIGLGIGPTAVALITDYVFGRDDAVGIALVIVLFVSLSISTVLLTLGQSAYVRTLAYRDRWITAHANANANANAQAY